MLWSTWHRHQRVLHIIEHFGHRAVLLLRVQDLAPQCLASRLQSVGEIIETRERRCMLQQAMPGITNVLLHLALLPAGGRVTELGLEQEMADHGTETGVDDRCLPRPTLSTAVFMLS